MPNQDDSWLDSLVMDDTNETARDYLNRKNAEYAAYKSANEGTGSFLFTPEEQGKSAVERQNILSSAVGLEGLQGLYRILGAEGLTPQQRAMFSAAMNRSLGAQAEQAGQGLGRRFAAQGISGTGLANSALGQIQSGLLGAQQQGEEGLNKMSLDLYQNALQSALGQNQFFRNLSSQERTAAQERKASMLKGLFGSLGDLAESVIPRPKRRKDEENG